MPRNSSGTYSLPAGNPVVSNTLIQSTWANPTMSDLGTGITDSLDRNGRGAMLAALKNIDGTTVAPAISFSSEGTLGLYRVAAGVLGIAAGGALILSIASTGLTFSSPVVLPLGTAAAPALTFTGNTNTGIYSPTTNQVAISTNGAQRLLVDATGIVTMAGQQLAFSTTGTNTIAATNAGGTLAIQTGGANNRITIDAAGVTVISGATTFSSTVAHAGVVTFNNNIATQIKDAGGTARRVLNLGPGGSIAIGDIDNGIAGGFLNLFANSTIQFETNNVARAFIDGTGLSLLYPLNLTNNLGIWWKDTGGTLRRMAVLNASNLFLMGDVDNAITGSVSYVRAQSQIEFDINTVSIISMSASSITASKTIFSASTVVEGHRIINDAGLFSIYNTANTTRTGYLLGATGSLLSLGAENGASLALLTNGSTRLRIDTAGNVGMGVTPSAWGTYSAFEGTAGALAFNGATAVGLSQNAYFNGTNWIYKATAVATLYQSITGQHQFLEAASGTAGTAITWVQAMLLDASGNLSVAGSVTATTAVTAGAANGFLSSTFVSNTQNPIWRFANALTFGLSYFQGTSGLDGANDTIGVHFGTATAAGSVLQIQGAGGRKGINVQGAALTPTTNSGNINGTFTLDWSVSNVVRATLTGNVTTFTQTNAQDGQTMNLFLTQDGTGSRTFPFTGIKFPGGAVPTLSTAAGAIDLLVLTRMNSVYYGSLTKAFA